MMDRDSFAEFERRCQKPDHRRVGNWMARHISRPAALHITKVVAPWGVSAHAVTLVAWGVAIAGACALGWGTIVGWLVGAGLLQCWYLLDHVDGQLARWHGTASLDGAQLDYLMHHSVDLLVPLGVGAGLFARTAEPWWLVAGLVWGLALCGITLRHETRYRAFVARLQRVQGRLEVRGGACGKPEPPPAVPRRPFRLAAWCARKLCEIHVIVNLLTLVALLQWLLGATALAPARYLMVVLTPTGVAVAVGTLVRSQTAGQCEREFAAWYQVPPGHELIYRDGWWIVTPKEPTESGGPATDRKPSPGSHDVL